MSEYTGANAYAKLYTLASEAREICKANFGEDATVAISHGNSSVCISIFGKWELMRSFSFFDDGEVWVSPATKTDKEKIYDSFQDFLEGEGI